MDFLSGSRPLIPHVRGFRFGAAVYITLCRMISILRALALATAFLIAACASIDPAQKDDWMVLRGEDEPPEIVLVRRKVPQEIQSRFPVLLRVTWFYDALPDGLPTDREIERGRALYAALDRIIEKDGVYAMSRTVAGARSMYYYVNNPRDHAENLRRFFESMPSIQVRISVHYEPEWASVRMVLDGVRH